MRIAGLQLAGTEKVIFDRSIGHMAICSYLIFWMGAFNFNLPLR